MQPRILFVEHTPEVARAVAAMLERHGFHVTRSDDGAGAAERLSTHHFDVLIVEVMPLQEDAGLGFLRHVHSTVPHLLPRTVVISNASPPAVQRELDAIGVCDIVLKPVHEEEILSAIRQCLDRTPATVH